MQRIFISYRRDDSKLMCDRIFEYLAAVFGAPSVFRDINTLPGGADFRRALDRALHQCKLVLVVIGPSWSTITGPDGQRRLDAPHDVVRAEIETALQRGLPVIPLLVQGAPLPQRNELPASISSLFNYQGRVVRDDPDFRRDMQTVVQDISRYVPLVPVRVVAWRRTRNAVSRTFSFLLTAATLLVVVNTILNWFHAGIPIPLITQFVQHWTRH
jgi:hypothetical protein